VKHDGKNADVVAQPTKQGFLFVFERETGKPLWPIEKRPVPKSDVPGEETWPTQPFPTKPPAFARQSFTEKDINPYITGEEKAKVREMLQTWRNEGLFTPPSLKGSIEIPGNNGGANWGSSGIDPTKGMIYIVSKELPMGLTLRLPGPPRAGRAGKDGKEPPPAPPPPQHDFVPYDAPYDFMIQASNGLSAIGPPWSQLTAIDLNSGTIKWQVPNGGVATIPQDPPTGAHFPRGGVVVTGGGLIFLATSSDRKFRAYDQDNGKVVWEYSLPAGSDGVPAVYEIAGREYVVIPIGGAGQTPPRAASAKELPPGPGGYLAFALPKK
jgi:quinoprotein glucose dehydrogenase